MNSTGSKKNLELSIEQKRLLVEPVKHSKEHLIPISRQCELFGLARSSYYYEPAVVDEYNLLLMRLIDEQYTQTPFYGIRRMPSCYGTRSQPQAYWTFDVTYGIGSYISQTQLE